MEERKLSLINIKYGKDWITLDLRCRQMRYLHDIADMGEIEFFPMSHSDVEAYENLFNEDRKLFWESLVEDLADRGLPINAKDCEVVKLQ